MVRKVDAYRRYPSSLALPCSLVCPLPLPHWCGVPDGRIASRSALIRRRLTRRPRSPLSKERAANAGNWQQNPRDGISVSLVEALVAAPARSPGLEGMDLAQKTSAVSNL